MTKIVKTFLAIFVFVSLFFASCTSKSAPDYNNPGENINPTNTAQNTQNSEINSGNTANSGDTAGSERKDADSVPEGSGSVSEGTTATPSTIDFEKIKPDESGKIMIIMFHRFIEKYSSGDKEYTTTFDEFRNLLQTLYEKGYRLISMTDYLNNNINVPAGCVPMVFTFDDGTPGQFNLIEENGRLTVNRQSAVGIMIEFNKNHPDFGLEGTFYVNLGGGTFEGKGTLAERLKYLIDLGFEIGNHTMNHIDLKKVTTAEKVQQEIGENQKRINELIPGYKMTTLALPLGHHTKGRALDMYIKMGEFEGIRYENLAVLEVGWDPAFSPVSKNFNPLELHRVRAPGIEPVDADLAWWLKNLDRKNEYVSDGDPDTVTVPDNKKNKINLVRLGNKKLVTY